MAVNYGNVYVARVAMGGSDMQTLKAFEEAEAYDGPSLIIAFSHCIAHGYDMMYGMDQQKLAVQSGYWPLFRYNPDLVKQRKNPLQLDSRPPSVPLQKYMHERDPVQHPEPRRCRKPPRSCCTRPKRTCAAAGSFMRSWLRFPLAETLAGRRPGGERRQGMTDLSTTYLGLQLKNPIVVSAGPLQRGSRRLSARWKTPAPPPW